MTHKNTTTPHRMLTFNLPHDTYCAKAGACACTKKTIRSLILEEGTGEKRWKIGERLVAASLMIPYGHEAELSDAHLAVPEIASAVLSGDLRAIAKQEAPRARRGRAKVKTEPEEPTNEVGDDS